MSVTSFHRACAAAVAALFIAAGAASAQDASGTFTPTEGQAGQDVVWVPTPESMVERMLDVA
jgi:hypothetical protein